jgi:hypothetical protein
MVHYLGAPAGAQPHIQARPQRNTLLGRQKKFSAGSAADVCPVGHAIFQRMAQRSRMSQFDTPAQETQLAHNTLILIKNLL